MDAPRRPSPPAVDDRSSERGPAPAASPEPGGPGRAVRLAAPGLAVVVGATAVAWGLARAPGLGLLGPLGLALLLGMALRLAAGPRPALRPGARFAARTLLRIGVVLLGARLQLDLLASAGPTALALALSVVIAGLTGMELLGRRLRVAPGLRRTLALGTSICGASAIAAAAPVVGADDDEAAVAVALVSLLGAAGVVAFALLADPLGLGSRAYALLAGGTLHEVGHVVAAGAARGPEALDLATLVKLVRVALLAPALLALGAFARGEARRAEGEGARGAARRAAPFPLLLPGFLIGFLALGAARGLGLVPDAWVGPLSTASLLLTAAAMAGIGLGVDPAGLRRAGGGALALALGGFAATLATAAAVLALA